jgi:hypothetical protein
MKASSIVFLYLALAGSLFAEKYPSPDQKWSVTTGQAVILTDASGAPVLTIDNNAAAAHLVQALWSPDSKRVVVIEDYPRGSGVFAAWFDGKSWDKTLQKDEDGAAAVKQAQGSGGGRLQAEGRLAKSWIDGKSVLIQGELQFSSGNSRAYHYILEFTDRQANATKAVTSKASLTGLTTNSYESDILTLDRGR